MSGEPRATALLRPRQIAVATTSPARSRSALEVTDDVRVVVTERGQRRHDLMSEQPWADHNLETQWRARTVSLRARGQLRGAAHELLRLGDEGTPRCVSCGLLPLERSNSS